MHKIIYEYKKIDKSRKWYWLLLTGCSLIIVQYFYLAIKYQIYESYIGSLLSLVLIISIATFYISVNKLILDIKERVLNKTNIELLKTEIKEIDKYIMNHKKHSLKIFKCYHDLANHASVFYMLIEKNELEEARKYYESLESMIMEIEMESN